MAQGIDSKSGFDINFYSYPFVTHSFFFFLYSFFKLVRIHLKNIFKEVFYSILWWLFEEFDFLFGMTSWNKFVIAKWRSVEFFFES